MNNIPKYIKSIRDYTNQFTKDKIYKARSGNIHTNRYFVESDDRGSITNGWLKENFIDSTEEDYLFQEFNLSFVTDEIYTAKNGNIFKYKIGREASYYLGDHQ